MPQNQNVNIRAGSDIAKKAGGNFIYLGSNFTKKTGNSVDSNVT